MHHLSLTALLAVLLLSASQAAAQDRTGGTVLAFDRKAKTLVLTDRTVWSLELLKSEAPAGLKAGDRIEIEYESDEDGISAIRDLRIKPPIPVKEGAPDVSIGTVLAFDRKAKTLVLTDRTVWTLESLNAEAPAGLQAGDRIKIEYQSDEDGISAINSLEIVPN